MIRAIMAPYVGAYGKVRTRDALSSSFRLSHGVLQGDTLAPFLFILVLDRVIKACYADLPQDTGVTLQPRRSSRSPGLQLTHTSFADDVTLICKNRAEANQALQALITNAARAGLLVNPTKCQVLSRGSTQEKEPIKAGDHILEEVTDTTYLGSRIGSVAADIKTRCGKASLAVHSLKPYWEHHQGKPEAVGEVFRSVVQSIMFCGCQCLPLTVKHQQKLQGTWKTLLRRALKMFDSPLDILLNMCGLRHPLSVIKSLQLKFIGHEIRKTQRELAQHDPNAIRPLSAVLTWRGTVPEKYTVRAGKVKKARAQRKGQGNKLTLFRALGSLLVEAGGASGDKSKKKTSRDHDAESYATLCLAAGQRSKWMKLTRDC